MERRETHHRQPLKLCQFLYTFFMKLFTRKTHRAVAPESPTSSNCTELPICDSSPPLISSTAHEIDPFVTLEHINGGENSSSIADHRAGGNGSSSVWIPVNGSAACEKGKEEEEEAKAPKKMVSFNENVEDINSMMKRRRKSMWKKAYSFGHQQEQDHHPKRPRSILRAGSDLNETLLSNPS